MVIPLKGCFRYVSQEYRKLWLFKSDFCDILIFGDGRMKKIKKRIFEIIQVAQDGDNASRIFDLFILALILINVLLVILDTFSLPAKVKSVFGVIETISVVIFPLPAQGLSIFSRSLSAIIAVLGIGLVAVPTGIISAGFMERSRKKTNIIARIVVTNWINPACLF